MSVPLRLAVDPFELPVLLLLIPEQVLFRHPPPSRRPSQNVLQSFVASLRQFLSGFRLPGESMLIERIMYDFSVQFYLDNPTFCEHLTPEKLKEIQTRFDECGDNSELKASALFAAIKGLEGDYKYMKNIDIA